MTTTSDSIQYNCDASLSDIREALISWFGDAARNLPWRRTRDPYHILVAEVMLQQTQVDRVVPKYQMFLNQFPTIEALAAAPTSEVIRAWSGLGYNRRAVNMQRTARAVLEQYGGEFPHDITELRALPGIGPYTAGALACFAYEQDVAFMDTNIRRVLRRVFVGPEERNTTSEAKLLTIAQAAVPPSKGWIWNQAIMELGALICTAASPACWRCPLRTYCRDYTARRTNDEQLFEKAAATRVQPRQRHLAERRESSYAGSNRFYRGRIVETLRQQPHGTPLALGELGRRIKEGFDDDEQAWLLALLEGLARDGLVLLEGESVQLPE
jgi:A/G-specific adenine glycosylase